MSTMVVGRLLGPAQQFGFAGHLAGSSLTPDTVAFTYGTVTVTVFAFSDSGSITLRITTGRANSNTGWDSVDITDPLTSTTVTLNRTDATFDDSSGTHYDWTWTTGTNPFGTETGRERNLTWEIPVSAQFGSGLQAWGLGRPHASEIAIWARVGRVRADTYNRYYGTSHLDTQMTLDGGTTGVTVVLECPTAPVVSERTQTFTIGDIDNDTLNSTDVGAPYQPTLDDPTSWWADALRRFFLTQLVAGTDYPCTLTTNCVLATGTGRLKSVTFNARCLPEDDLTIATASCFMQSAVNESNANRAVAPRNAFGESYNNFSPDADAGNDWGSNTTIPIVTITRGATTTVEYSGSTHPEEYQPIRFEQDVSGFVGPESIENQVALATNVNTTLRTFDVTNLDYSLIDTTGETAYSAGEFGLGYIEPSNGIIGRQAKSIVEGASDCFVTLDDLDYGWASHTPWWTPPAHSQTALAGFPDTLSVVGMSSFSWDSDSGSLQTDHLANQLQRHARLCYCDPAFMSIAQSIPVAHIRGDHDLIPANDFNHVPWKAGAVAPNTRAFGDCTLFADTTLYPGSTETGDFYNDTNYVAAQTEICTMWARHTEVWNVYFGGNNPKTFAQHPTTTYYPPALTAGAAAVGGGDPAVEFGAVPEYYYPTYFSISNNVVDFICPDAVTHRGAIPVLASNRVNVSSVINYIMGGEPVHGVTQNTEIKALLLARQKPWYGFGMKGMVLGLAGTAPDPEVYPIDVLEGAKGFNSNPDSMARSTETEATEFKAMLESLKNKVVLRVGDRHIQSRVTNSSKIVQLVDAGIGQTISFTYAEDDVANAYFAYGLTRYTATQTIAKTIKADGTNLFNKDTYSLGSAEVAKIQTTMIPTRPYISVSDTVDGMGQATIGGGLAITPFEYDFINTADDSVIARMLGWGNRNSGPAQQKGAFVVFEQGVGAISAVDDDNGDDLTSFGFSITVGGYTLDGSVVTGTHINQSAVSGDTFKSFVARDSLVPNSFFGGAENALNGLPEWEASTDYSVGDRVVATEGRYIGICFEVTVDEGSSGVTEPSWVPTIGVVTSDNYIPATQGLQWTSVYNSFDTELVTIQYTDPGASSGGGGSGGGGTKIIGNSIIGG